MKPKFADLAIVCTIAAWFMLGSSADAYASYDYTCLEARSCQKGGIDVEGVWYINIEASGGAGNAPGVMWAAYDSKNAVVCSIDLAKLEELGTMDSHGSWRVSAPCDFNGVGPYVVGAGFASDDYRADWHVSIAPNAPSAPDSGSADG
ncbi:hypothetical protein [Nocardia brasiliensis]|uniref:hypothetical protein n=1 Tax=Nocardia brasiliensis TaxID=37326 RepID=UPI00114D0C2F|nr:hypothetical protein [Nocardia brasiliensis]